MRPTLKLLVAFLPLTLAGCGTAPMYEPDTNLEWGSSQATLSLEGGLATLRLLADGGCVGSYAVAEQSIASLSFDLSGTFTQLIGAYPGKLNYPAQISGAIRDNVMTLTVTAAGIPLVIGPLILTRGVMHNDWSMCLYP